MKPPSKIENFDDLMEWLDANDYMLTSFDFGEVTDNGIEVDLTVAPLPEMVDFTINFDSLPLNFWD